VAFFDKFGFVVVRDVLTPQEAQATVNEILGLLEVLSPFLVSPHTTRTRHDTTLTTHAPPHTHRTRHDTQCEQEGTEGRFDRHDVSTWDQWPADGMAKHGMPSRPPLFTPQILRNRQNPRLVSPFALLFGSEDIMISHDRCACAVACVRVRSRVCVCGVWSDGRCRFVGRACSGRLRESSFPRASGTCPTGAPAKTSTSTWYFPARACAVVRACRACGNACVRCVRVRFSVLINAGL
jgi:hypothetical protein